MTTLTNSNGIQTTIRLQSDEAVVVAPAPEPASLLLAAAGLAGLVIRGRRSR